MSEVGGRSDDRLYGGTVGTAPEPESVLLPGHDVPLGRFCPTARSTRSSPGCSRPDPHLPTLRRPSRPPPERTRRRPGAGLRVPMQPRRRPVRYLARHRLTRAGVALVDARGEEVATVFGAALAFDGQGTIDDAWARLSLLAEVSDTLIRTLDTGQSADHLARLVVPRLADWATGTVPAEDGADQPPGRAPRAPARLGDLDPSLPGRPAGARSQSALAAALQSGHPLRLSGADSASARTAA